MLLDGSPVQSLDDHRRRGGLAGLAAVDDLGPDGVIEELVASGLRGRGGAGFPTGIKWRTLSEGGAEIGQRFVVANGAEGEPGTFKDRTLLRHNPFALIEGLLIAARTLGAARAFVALKASFDVEARRIAAAAAEFAAAGLAPDVQIELVRGPDEYLFGEEKALLEVIEGEDPLPRLFPPYVYGLFTTSPQLGWSAGSSLADPGRSGSNPTLVNNVETLSTVPLVVGRGADWYRGHGTPRSPGTIVCTVSGDTIGHGVGEFEMGTPLDEVIDRLGHGLPAGRRVKYVLSGVSNPVIRADHLDVPLSYEALDGIGAGLGTGGFMVFDDRTDPRELAAAVSRFLYVESCGQCPACKLGTARITELLEPHRESHNESHPEDGAENGAAGDLRPVELGELTGRLGAVTDSSRCYLPTQEQRLVSSLLPDIGVDELRQPRRGLMITKIVDLVDGRFVLDGRQAHKRPDWSYDDGLGG